MSRPPVGRRRRLLVLALAVGLLVRLLVRLFAPPARGVAPVTESTAEAEAGSHSPLDRTREQLFEERASLPERPAAVERPTAVTAVRRARRVDDPDPPAAGRPGSALPLRSALPQRSAPPPPSALRLRSAARRSARRVRVPVAAAIVVALVGAVGVFAYSSGSGSGSGSGSVRETHPVTITPGTAVDRTPGTALTDTPGTAANGLYPGGSADVVATISNRNSIAIHLPSLELDTARGTDRGFSVDAAHSGCNLDSLSFNGAQTDGGHDFAVPASGTLQVDLPGAVSMDTSAVDACQGATVTVYLQVGA